MNLPEINLVDILFHDDSGGMYCVRKSFFENILQKRVSFWDTFLFVDKRNGYGKDICGLLGGEQWGCIARGGDEKGVANVRKTGKHLI